MIRVLLDRSSQRGGERTVIGMVRARSHLPHEHERCGQPRWPHESALVSRTTRRAAEIGEQIRAGAAKRRYGIADHVEQHGPAGSVAWSSTDVLAPYG